MVVATTVMIAPIGVAQTVPPESEPGVVTQSSDPVPGQYIVRLRSASAQDVPQKAAELTRWPRGRGARRVRAPPCTGLREYVRCRSAGARGRSGRGGSGGRRLRARGDDADDRHLGLVGPRPHRPARSPAGQLVHVPGQAAVVHAYIIDSGILHHPPGFRRPGDTGPQLGGRRQPGCSTDGREATAPTWPASSAGRRTASPRRFRSCRCASSTATAAAPLGRHRRCRLGHRAR